MRSLWKEGEFLSAAEVWLPVSPGRRTLIPLEGFSDIEIRTERDLANGSFRFRRERMVEGKAEFSAERTGEGWRIVEFRLPVADAATRLGDDGAWKLLED